ncbi:MAG TPA: phospho-N-acetylmuramoyl-pentapeptide-transferase [Phycisphaerales bacterium]|nr:phospho-N-acetylmuramoyl-pentapeptide-transferase [Phycisphaerales bacterium]
MLYNLIEATRAWLIEVGVYRFVMVLDQLGFRAFLAGFLSFAVVLAAGPRVIRWLREKKIGDKAQFDVAALNAALASKANTPTMGGVLISGAILASTLLLADLRNPYIQFGVIAVVWLAAVGGVDDWLKLTASSRPGGSRQGLYAWEKLVLQLGVGLLIGVFAHRAGYSATPPSMAHVLNLPFQKSYESPSAGANPSLITMSVTAYALVCLLMMTGMSNAVNITDGMDGLATGITVAVATGLLILCFIAGDESAAKSLLVPYVPTSDELAILCASTVGACLGFLWWNCSPAQVFMGDTGALFLGGLLGYVAVVIRQEAVALIMSGVFLLEIGSVVLQVGYFKWSKGKRIFRCAPYHWHLHQGGWREQTIVTRFWIVSVLLVAVALASLKLR